MSRKVSLVGGWVLIAIAVLCSLAVPVWNVQGIGTDGFMIGESSPFRTTVVGTGQFTHEAYWSVWWPGAVACGVALCSGVLLLRRHPAVTLRTV